MFNLQALFSSLLGQGLEKAAAATPDPTLAGAPTTIRLSPEARAFYTAQAEAFGQISMSSFIAMTLEGVMRATQGNSKAQPQDQVRRRIETVRDRFLHVYRAHAVEPQTMAALLQEHGVTASTLCDENALLNVLTDPLLRHVSEHFHVELDWLTGERDYSTRPAEQRWYKSTQGAIRNLIDQLKSGLRPEVIVVRRRGADFSSAYEKGDSIAHEPVGILIQTERKAPGGRTYKAYEAWDFERWNYPKCRHYLKALLLWLHRQAQHPSFHGRIHLWGVTMEPDVLRQLMAGALLPVEALELAYKEGAMWYPGDYVDGTLESAELAIVQQYFYDNARLDELFAELTVVGQ